MPILKNKVISIYNRKTSMRLAVEEWNALDDICLREHIKRKKLLELLNDAKDPAFGLTCFVRLFITAYMHRLANLAEIKIKSRNSNQDIFHVLDLIA